MFTHFQVSLQVICHNKGILIFNKAKGVSFSYFIINSNTPEYFMFCFEEFLYV